MTYLELSNRTIDVRGHTFAYRDVNQANGGTPIVLFNHLAATLDNWDPLLIDHLSRDHRVIVFDNLGVGGTSGEVPLSIQQMAQAAYAFTQALGLTRFHAFGQSMGGFVVQELLAIAPDAVDRAILTGTGPRGGVGIDRVPAVTFTEMVRAFLTREDVKRYLFFPHDTEGKQAAHAYLSRLNSRPAHTKDAPIRLRSFLRQLIAIRRWAREPAANLSAIEHDLLIMNGEDDLMVPTAHSYAMHQRFPHAELVIYPHAGHGAIFQYPEDVACRTHVFVSASND